MARLPDDLRRRLERTGQDHLVVAWERHDLAARQTLLTELKQLDLEQLRVLYQMRDATIQLPGPDQIAPPPLAAVDDQACRMDGEHALRRGEVAVLMVAGGQGSRLGFEHPKGMFPVGPVSGKSLYQLHAEKVRALARRYGRQPFFLVMTSPINHLETVRFFEEHDLFRLDRERVAFFQQGVMPALDLRSGRLLFERPGKLFLSPNGHGGALIALAEHGLMERLRQAKVRQVFYFQVDNPLVRIADPAFVGQHRLARAQVSTKVVPKRTPEDRLGNVVVANGRKTIIEYSDLPRQLARLTDERGRLKFSAGNTAIHIFDLPFLERVTSGVERIPFHVARKRVPHWDVLTGEHVEPDHDNALKFEMFVFDVLPRAERWSIVETTRKDEFEPLKNAEGEDSPMTVKQAISEQAAEWLERAGVKVPRDDRGCAAFPLEIDPELALDADELAQRLDRSARITGPTLFRP